MPIWIELIILLLLTYAIGLAIGWLVWGRAPLPAHDPMNQETSEGDTPK